MLYNKEINEAFDVMSTMLDALMTGLPSRGESGATLRRAVGVLRANAPDYVDSYSIGTQLGTCFEQARLAGASLSNMDNVRAAMIAVSPEYSFGIAMKNAGITFSLVEQCKIIATIKFVSRFDVEIMMQRMAATVDEVKLEVAELIDGISYRYVVELSSALIQHLAVTERQLPRIVSAIAPAPLPTLWLANYFYDDASRSDEIADENKVVHPAFCMRDLRVLSE